jgi:hypothetical protein
MATTRQCEYNSDSDDEFLLELCRARPACEGDRDDDDDDEWLKCITTFPRDVPSLSLSTACSGSFPFPETTPPSHVGSVSVDRSIPIPCLGTGHGGSSPCFVAGKATPSCFEVKQTTPTDADAAMRFRGQQIRRQGPRRAQEPLPLHGDAATMLDDHALEMSLVNSHSHGRIQQLCIQLLIKNDDSDAFARSALCALAAGIADRVRQMLTGRGICIFKIGITRSPLHRAYNNEYGYFRRGEIYDHMHVLAATYPAVAVFLERNLIAVLRSERGCRNVSDGGESPPPSGLCYVYVVSLEVGNGRPIPMR